MYFGEIQSDGFGLAVALYIFLSLVSSAIALPCLFIPIFLLIRRCTTKQVVTNVVLLSLALAVLLLAAFNVWYGYSTWFGIGIFSLLIFWYFSFVARNQFTQLHFIQCIFLYNCKEVSKYQMIINFYSNAIMGLMYNRLHSECWQLIRNPLPLHNEIIFIDNRTFRGGCTGYCYQNLGKERR